MTTRKTAVIAGAKGIIGRGISHHLANEGWLIINVSREADPNLPNSLAIDLLDRSASCDILYKINAVTHVFYAAYQPRATVDEEIQPNVEMLKNLLAGLNYSKMQRVVLLQGTKAYGSHLGAFSVPAMEDSKRPNFRHFYFEQEDLLREKSKGSNWSWTVFRPGAIGGWSVGSPMNIVGLLAGYAAIMKELSLPLHFPGHEEAYRARNQATDTSLLGRGAAWAACSPRCSNEIVNITNGDSYSWMELWPIIASLFKMNVGSVKPISLEEFMCDSEALWKRIVERHRLVDMQLKDIASWRFGDRQFGRCYDTISSNEKRHQLGFTEKIDSRDMFVRLIKILQSERIVPH